MTVRRLEQRQERLKGRENGLEARSIILVKDVDGFREISQPVALQRRAASTGKLGQSLHQMVVLLGWQILPWVSTESRGTPWSSIS